VTFLTGNDAHRLGYWSALLTVVWVLLFTLSLVIGLMGPSTAMFSYLVCLLLAPSFVVMMAGIHYQAPAEKRIWSHLGLTFAEIYAVLIVIVYYVQLTAVRNGSAEALRPFTYAPGTVWFALDMLGYVFMCLATWFAAPVFNGADRLSRWIRGFFILHGILAISTFLVPVFMKENPGAPAGNGGVYALLAWCVIYVPLALLVARYFGRAMARERKAAHRPARQAR
jgi:hypothetical protein